jgi:YggT family protein
MIILAQLFSSLALLFSMIFKILYFLLVARIIVSWFSVDPYNSLVNALVQITDPILAPLRRIPLQAGMVDFTPILAFLILAFLDNFIVGILTRLAYQFAGQ